MDIEKFIIAIMAFILFGGIALMLVGDLYKPSNLDVNLSNDRDTEALNTLQTQLTQSQADINSYNNQMADKVLGNATFKKDISTGDLLTSAWSALTNIPNYIATFFSLISGIVGTILGGSGIWMWFFIGIVAIGLAITVINTILWGKIN